jgi:hypothetical protein
VEILSRIQNFVTALRFSRRIVRTGVRIDFVTSGVQVDSPDMQRLMNITDIMREYAQRLPL